MDEAPAMAIRRKPHSSIAMALKEVKEGRSNAMVSAGHSGAVVTGSLAILGRVPGVQRPALAVVLPTPRGTTMMLDLGAFTDPKPSHLVQFAHMAKVYAETAFSKPNPTIGLLSNGEEPTKGNQLVQDVFPLFQADTGLNFVGNIEGKEILQGTIDVVVTDGFTGNVVLKSMEGTASAISEVLREELMRGLHRKILAGLLRPAFRSVRARMNYEMIGGAPLLGVNGVVIGAHGRSQVLAIQNAVRAGRLAAEQDLPRRIQEELANTN